MWVVSILVTHPYIQEFVAGFSEKIHTDHTIFVLVQLFHPKIYVKAEIELIG